MNTEGVQFVHWPGLACSAVGGIFWLLAYAKGKQKRQLESATPVGKLSDLKKHAGNLPLLIAVTGQASTDRPINGELSNEPCVITEVREQQQLSKRTGNNRWVRDNATLRHTRSETSWGVSDGTAMLPIVDGHGAHLTLPIVVETFSSGPQRGIIRTGLDLFSGFQVLGYTVTEHSLPLGTPLTCVGELARAPRGSVAFSKGAAAAGADGLLVLKAPTQGDMYFITTSSLPELISSISGIARTCKWLAVGFGAVGAALVAWKLSGGIVTVARRRKLRRRVEEANRRLEEARVSGGGGAIADGATAGIGNEAGDRDDNLCAICLEHPSAAVFAACGHMCTCWDCAQRMDRCPLCRSRTHAIKVYRP